MIKLSDAKPSPKAEQMKIDAPVKATAPAAPVKKQAPPPPPAPAAKKPFPAKTSGGSSGKKSQPLKEEAAVTVEWDLTANEKITNDRNRILSDLEKKSKEKIAHRRNCSDSFSQLKSHEIRFFAFLKGQAKNLFIYGDHST
ncbi:MAG: hypothetical protein IPJ66_18230 [Bacteroidetes bacterium]|nr:hypothetical protein [Bacteroidota bacterium]